VLEKGQEGKVGGGSYSESEDPGNVEGVNVVAGDRVDGLVPVDSRVRAIRDFSVTKEERHHVPPSKHWGDQLDLQGVLLDPGRRWVNDREWRGGVQGWQREREARGGDLKLALIPIVSRGADTRSVDEEAG